MVTVVASGAALSTVYFSDKIVPGVRVAGVAVGGLDKGSAMEKLAKEWGNREQYLISVRAEIELQEKLLSEDARFVHDMVDNAWDSDLLRKG